MAKKSPFCNCGSDHTKDNSVYRLLNVTGHLEDGSFKEDDGPDGDGSVFCVQCDQPVKGV